MKRRSIRWTVMFATLSAIVGGRLSATEPNLPEQRILRVTADPNNLPFSNAAKEGFENRIVELIARELGATVEYTWWAQRRGWVRNNFRERDCDLVPGVPEHFDRLLTTRPYYRASYAMVYRRDRGLRLRSIDDPALRDLRLGVQMIGDDAANTPPAHALASRGLIDNVRGFTVYGDYAQPNPPARIVDAVLAREIDVAFVWGPLAGYCAKQHPGELEIVNLPGKDPTSEQPFEFAISVGIRRTQRGLRDAINDIILRKQAEIDTILAEYGVTPPNPNLQPPERHAAAAPRSVTHPFQAPTGPPSGDTQPTAALLLP